MINKEIKEIKEILNKLIKLLIDADYDDYSHIFNLFYRKIDIDPDETLREILSLYGGMGSFNDLVLYKKGMLLKNENNELSKLRQDLYNKIQNLNVIGSY